MKFLLVLIAWCILLVLCWLLALPFRLARAGTEAVFALIRALRFLPARLPGSRRHS